MNKLIFSVLMIGISVIPSGCDATYTRNKVKLPQEHTIVISNAKSFLSNMRDLVLDFNQACDKSLRKNIETVFQEDVFGGFIIHKMSGNNFIFMTVTPERDECIVVIYWENAKFDYEVFKNHFLFNFLLSPEDDTPIPIIEES